MADASPPPANRDALRRLTQHSAIYALGPLAQKAIGFLLLPFVTVYIRTVGNYGIVELSATLVPFAAQILGINLLHGMTRFYPEYESEEERGRLVSTCFLLLAGSTGTALLAAFLFRERAAELFFGSSAYGGALVAVAGILCLQTLGQVGLRWLQIVQRSVAYGVLTTLKTVFEVGLKVWFLAGLGLTFMGVLYSVLGGEAAVAIGVVVWIARRLGFTFSWPMAKRLLRYSYPLILGGLPMFALHQADRWFVKHYQGDDGVGFYGIAYKLGSLGNALLLESFGLVWFPFIFSVRGEESVRSICRMVVTYFTALMCCASLALAIFSPEIVRLMADAKFFESHRAMPIVVAGYVGWAVHQVASTGLYLKQRTGILSGIIAGAAALNLALNAVLVPEHGYLGAAWATVATFGVLAAATWIVAERVAPLGFDAWRTILPIVFAVVLFAASRQIPSGDAPAGIAMRSALVLLLPVALWTCGYLRAGEKEELRSVVRSLARLGRS